VINGTENCVALASKGALRFEIIARGKLAHSAYPELGHSAIHALLDVLRDLRRVPLPHDTLLGASTLNIGSICGGRVPNVVADEARSEIMFRTVGDPSSIREAVSAVVAGRAEAREVVHTSAVCLSGFDGLPPTVVAFATDIPALGGNWGKPFLIGPGSIHLAHTAEEHIAKKSIVEAVEIYCRMVTPLLAAEQGRL
jgi:acetylornithine deacetylase